MTENDPCTRPTLLQRTRDSEHTRCFFCGQKRAGGRRLEFRAAGDGVVTARVESGVPFEGYDGILHGGATAAILDAAMTNCLFSLGIIAVTAELRVRYLSPATLSRPVEATAEITRLRGPLCHVRAQLTQDRTVLARAEATFMRKDRASRPGTGHHEPRGREP